MRAVCLALLVNVASSAPRVEGVTGQLQNTYVPHSARTARESGANTKEMWQWNAEGKTQVLVKCFYSSEKFYGTHYGDALIPTAPWNLFRWGRCSDGKKLKLMGTFTQAKFNSKSWNCDGVEVHSRPLTALPSSNEAMLTLPLLRSIACTVSLGLCPDR